MGSALLHKHHRVLYWGSADQPFDVTTKDDVARYTAAVALDEAPPRFLRIAGDVVTGRSLAATMTSITGRSFGLWRAGGLGRLGLLIRVVHTLTPRSDAVFPTWQGMQYLRDMSSGLGKLDPLDNDRSARDPGPLPGKSWRTAREIAPGRVDHAVSATPAADDQISGSVGIKLDRRRLDEATSPDQPAASKKRDATEPPTPSPRRSDR